MAKMLKILQVNNEEELKTLREISKDVTMEELKSDDFQNFLDDLVFTAKNTETEEGYRIAGLAAIQVGVSKRVFCILNDDDEFEILINPEIKVINNKQVIGLEACLSIPKIQGNVLRSKKIKVTYIDRNGKKMKERFTNWESREIQHEYDHLEGVLFTDKSID